MSCISFLSTPVAVVNGKTKNIHVTMENRMIGEEVVIRLEDRGGTMTEGSARFFIGSEEIGVTPVKIAVEILPVGVRIEVVVAHIETVSEVWVTPVHKVEGVEACVDMVDKISEILDYKANEPIQFFEDKVAQKPNPKSKQ